MSWYNTPSNDKVTIAGGVCISRNLTKYRFSYKLDSKDCSEILKDVGGLLENNGFTQINFSEISPTEAVSFAERRLVSSDFAKLNTPHALFVNEPCNLAVSIGGSEHIVIRCITSSADSFAAYNNARRAEELIDSKFMLAYADNLGYLTQNPSLLGTAMQAFAILFLPALSYLGKIQGFTYRLLNRGVVLRPLYDSRGCLYEITNMNTLGMSEDDILSLIRCACNEICDSELSASAVFTGVGKIESEDRCMRAKASLGSARILPEEEFLDLYASVRLGERIDSLKGELPDSMIMNSLLVETMPATLTLSASEGIKNEFDRNVYRASLVKSRLTQAALNK